MATLNLNSVLCNTSINVVVNARMGIGSQLVGTQALAILSQGWPVPTGLRPADPMWAALAMKRFYREATRERAGRSAVSPSAGSLLASQSPNQRGAAISTRWHCAADRTVSPTATTRKPRRSFMGLAAK
jgi:hypothetical protein